MMRHISDGFEALARAWCSMMHRDPMWPMHGYYQCPTCHRRYRVPWETPAGEEPERNARVKAARGQDAG